MKSFIATFLLILSVPSRAAISNGCSETRQKLFEEFLPIDFEKERRAVGEDQLNPVMLKLRNFAASTQDKITDIEIRISSSKVPFYMTQGKKRVLDPESSKISEKLLSDRKDFALKSIKKLQEGSLLLKDSKFTIETKIDGPEFLPLDLNLRFVTPESPMSKGKDLKGYPNLFQAKFRPFEGFFLTVFGNNNCSKKSSPQLAPTAIKQ
jgi:hypothetical protein